MTEENSGHHRLSEALAAERSQLLSETLGQLLRARDPDSMVRQLLTRVAAHLKADASFSFLVNDKGDAFYLHSCDGISEEIARSIQSLHFAQPLVSGDEPAPIAVTHIQNKADPGHKLAREVGQQSYACLPLLIGGRFLGTLGFASRSQPQFQPAELEFLQVIAQYTAIALDRLSSARDLEKLAQALKESEAKLKEHAQTLEVRVNERTASLREAVAQMEEFSYSVSHDLQSPLRAMQGYAAALMEDYGSKLDEQGRHFLHRIVNSSSRMERLVQDILTYSRLNRREISPQPIVLDRLLRDIIQQYPEMQPPNAIIESEPLLNVTGHEPSLSQAISNLLSNAVKFVPPAVTPRVRVRTEARDGRIRLWVEDNGIGVRPQDQPRLFGMFERLHPDKKYPGTGIGLAIVRRAMDRMGGQAGMESDGVNGSRFWIELPKAENPSS